MRTGTEKQEYSLNIGLKLYSTNSDLIPAVRDLDEENQFDYIELFVVPGSSEEHLNKWQGLSTDFVIHAPHSLYGVNLASRAQWQSNRKIFEEVLAFSDELGSSLIIVHGGVDGSFEETLYQISLLDDPRIVLENKPRKGINGEQCIGWSPDEFDKAMRAGKLNGMALDFVHAACAAYYNQTSFRSFVDGFLRLQPRIYHLADANAASAVDNHLNFGQGSMELEFILSRIPADALVTLETPRRDPNSLNDFLNDIG